MEKDCFYTYEGIVSNFNIKGKLVLKTEEYNIHGNFLSRVDCNDAVQVYKNGDRYEGNIRDLRFHGKGRLSRREGEKQVSYHGGFDNGKKNGIFEVFTNPNGVVQS